ncbi:MAG: hypothetical protein ACN4GZ_15490 [Acidimicrobiales bacterium]
MRVTRRFSALLLALTLGATACGLGTGANREALVDILIVEADLTTEEANCVANALYATPGLTEDDINSFSVIKEMDPGDERAGKFALYETAVDTAVRTCI